MRLLKVVAVVLAASLCLFAAENPLSGTWKINPAHSTPPVPKSDIAVVDADDTGLKFSEEMIDEKGQAMKLGYEAKFDGKDYPITGDPNSDAISYRRINARTFKGTVKKSGKVTAEFTVVVSADGKTTTVTYTDLSHDKPVKSTSVYDKQ